MSDSQTNVSTLLTEINKKVNILIEIQILDKSEDWPQSCHNEFDQELDYFISVLDSSTDISI